MSAIMMLSSGAVQPKFIRKVPGVEMGAVFDASGVVNRIHKGRARGPSGLNQIGVQAKPGGVGLLATNYQGAPSLAINADGYAGGIAGDAPFTILIYTDLPAVTGDQNEWYVSQSAITNGNEMWVSFRALSGQMRVQLYARKDWTTVLEVNYTFTSAVPLSLLRFDFDGTTGRILLNGLVLASASKTDTLVVKPWEFVLSGIAQYSYTTGVLFALQYKGVLSDRFGVGNPWQLFTQPRSSRLISLPPLFDKIDETEANASDYIETFTPGARFEVKLGPMDVPATRTGLGYRLQGMGTGTLNTSLVQGNAEPESMFMLPSKQIRQPQYAIQVDPRVYSRRAFVWTPFHNETSVVNSADTSLVSTNHGVSRFTSPATGDRTAWQSRSNVGIAGASPRSIFLRLRTFHSAALKSYVAYGAQASGALVEVAAYSGLIVLHFWGSGWDTITGAPSISNGNEYNIAFTYDGGTTVKTFLNGVRRNTTTLPGALNTTDSILSSGGAPAFWSTPNDHSLTYCVVVDREVSESFVAEVNRNPWQLFAPVRSSRFISIPKTIATRSTKLSQGPAIILPSKQVRQPRAALPLAARFAKGAQVAVNYGVSGTNLVTGVPGEWAFFPVLHGRRSGSGFKTLNNYSGPYYYYPVSLLAPNSPWTVLVRYENVDSSGATLGIFSIGAAPTSSNPWLHCGYNSGDLRIYVDNNYRITVGGLLVTGGIYNICLTYGGGVVRLFVNGSLLGSYSSASLGSISPNFYVGTGWGAPAGGHFTLAYFAANAVSFDDAIDLSANPWQLFEPIKPSRIIASAPKTTTKTPIIILPSRQVRQPQRAASINRANQFGRRVLFAINYGATLHDIVSGTPPSIINAGVLAERRATRFGLGVTNATGGAAFEENVRWFVDLGARGKTQNNVTLVAVLRIGQLGGSIPNLDILAVQDGVSTYGYRWMLDAWSTTQCGVTGGEWWQGTLARNFLSASSVEYDRDVLLVSTRRREGANAVWTHFENGVRLGSSTIAADLDMSSNSSNRVRLTTDNGASRSSRMLTAILDGALPDTAAAALSANPWQLFSNKTMLGGVDIPDLQDFTYMLSEEEANKITDFSDLRIRGEVAE